MFVHGSEGGYERVYLWEAYLQTADLGWFHSVIPHVFGFVQRRRWRVTFEVWRASDVELVQGWKRKEKVTTWDDGVCAFFVAVVGLDHVLACLSNQPYHLVVTT